MLLHSHQGLAKSEGGHRVIDEEGFDGMDANFGGFVKEQGVVA